MNTLETRFVGLDLHRHDVMVAAVNHKQISCYNHKG
jgi:hypothetical protein